MSTVASLMVKINGDMSGLEKSLQGAQGKLNAFGDNMLRMGGRMTAGVTVPIVAAFAGIGKAAMDLEATEAKYNAVFDGMTDTSDQFIKDFQKLTPATTAEARSMASGIQDLLVPMGFMREEATGLTEEFMHVTGALANFNSGTHTAADVANAMQSALSGQYMPLRSLGIQLDKTTIYQKALEQGLVSSRDEMTKQIEAQVMLSEVYAQSGDALGAYTEENLDAKTKMALMKAELIDVAAQMGQQLLPMLTQVADGLRGLIEWFSGLTESQQRTIAIILAVVAAIGPLLLVIGVVAKGIALLIGVVKGLAAVFVVLKGAAIAIGAIIGTISAPVLIVIGVIAALIAIGVLLYKNWDQVSEWLVAAWEWIKEKATEIFEGIKDFFVGIWESIRDTAQERARETRERLTSIWESTKDRAQAIWSSIRDIGGGRVGEMFDIIQGWMEKIRDFIVRIFGGIFDFYKGIFKAIKALFRGDTEEASRIMIETYQNLFNFIVGIFSSIVSAIGSAFSSLISATRSRANEIRQSVVSALQSMLSWIGGLPGRMRSLGVSMMQGMINGLRSMARRLINAALGPIRDAIAAAKKLLGISSPSRVFAQMGGNMAEGLVTGMDSAAGQVASAAGRMAKISIDAGLGASPNGTLTVKHELDLRNVPDSIDAESLENRLIEALNNPQVRRKVDRVSYQNKTDAVRGLGG